MTPWAPEHEHLQEVPVLGEPHVQALVVRGVTRLRRLEPGDRDAVPVQLGEQSPSCVRRRRRERSSRGRRLHPRAGVRAAVLAHKILLYEAIGRVQKNCCLEGDVNSKAPGST